MAKRLNRRELAEHVGQLIASERNATHGDPHIQFACQRALMEVLERHPSFAELGPTERHAMEMITTKISRIACGANIQDTWVDISGYALIAAEVAEKPLTK